MRRTLQITIATLLTISSGSSCRAENKDLTKGMQDYRAGHYAEAAKDLNTAVTSDFNDPILHYYLGSAYVRLNQKEAAIREFRIAFALQPDAEVGRLAKQGLAMLGIEMGSDVEVTTMFIIAAPPKPKLPADVVAGGGQALADMLARLQKGYLSNVFTPPQNGAEHSNQLQPLGPEWRQGERFDDSKLPICKCDGPWFRLPTWLAGTWKTASESVTQTYFQDITNKAQTPQNGESTVARPVKSEHHAVVRDRQGNYWDHPCIPNVLRETLRGAVQVNVGVKFVPVESTNQKVVTYYRWINFSLTNDFKIKSVVQCELISTYMPIGTGNCQKIESFKEFDEKGAPLRLAKYRFYLTQTLPPKVPATDAGRDYMALFRKYLKDANQLDLMP